jgi:hypothetical protein
MKTTLFLIIPLCLAPATLIFNGCGGGGASGGDKGGSPQLSRSVILAPYREPWQQARPRFMDIDDRPFSNAFAQNFSYATADVTLFYDPTPQSPYFIGKIQASGLKPNFAYQLKLAGKPQFGSRGWGSAGDDFSNEAIGRAARWWNDSQQINTTDSGFNNNYKNLPENQKQTVYGYLFMGNFVTDANGNAEREFSGSKSYHITWQDKQNTSLKHVVAGTYNIGSTQAPFLGYEQNTPNISVKLWYEYESGRPKNVKLPKGNYNCRLLITEETFHSATPDNKGGLWPTVLATEDFDSDGNPDTDTTNDVRFEIK